MKKKQIKDALISIVIGALTIFLVNLLEGLLNFLKEWMANGAGGTVAAGIYFIKSFKS